MFTFAEGPGHGATPEKLVSNKKRSACKDADRDIILRKIFCDVCNGWLGDVMVRASDSRPVHCRVA